MYTKQNCWTVKLTVILWFRIIWAKWFHAIVDTTLKIGKLSSLEEIAVGIAGERSTKSGALSHYEDRRERKGWLVDGVHGISIARWNNWVQSGRLPYVTSAPFKRESASASSSSSLILVLVPVLPFSPFSSSPGLASAPAKRPARPRKKKPEEGDYRAKCTRTREGRARERGRKGRKRQKETERNGPRET